MQISKKPLWEILRNLKDNGNKQNLLIASGNVIAHGLSGFSFLELNRKQCILRNQLNCIINYTLTAMFEARYYIIFKIVFFYYMQFTCKKLIRLMLHFMGQVRPGECE